jgi:hypothetical protein
MHGYDLVAAEQGIRFLKKMAPKAAAVKVHMNGTRSM